MPSATNSMLLGQQRYGAMLAVDIEAMPLANATHVLTSSMANRTSRPVDSALLRAVRRSRARSCSAEPSAAARRFFSATAASFSSVSCHARRRMGLEKKRRLKAACQQHTFILVV